MKVVKDVAAEGAGWAKDQVSAQKERLGQVSSSFKQTLETWMKQKVTGVLERLVDRLPQIVKDNLEDEQMPRLVSNGKDRAVDAIWPDIKEEIMWEINLAIDAKKDGGEAFGSRPDCVRRFLRYHIYPCDKTLWGRLRDPFWWTFTLVSLIPIQGLCPAVYFLLFLIIDKSDDFQLVAFILQFKGTQFISNGIIRTFTGFFVYLSCVTVPAQEDHSCAEDGPGVAGQVEVTLAGWVLQILLVWCAFLLLRCAKQRARQVQGNVEHKATGSGAQSGGYLRYFLYYDFVCFLACCIALTVVITMRPGGPDYDDWPVKHTLFACQVAYGYLSMPFFFFTLPILQTILTHAVPTAYDSEGRCCRDCGPDRKPLKDAQQRPQPQEPTAYMEDARHVAEEIKALIFGGSGSPDEEMDEAAALLATEGVAEAIPIVPSEPK